ncbi:TetR/AcrR family transcriptional regulator [Actinocorallia sp. A-T 12471]|uniref:TetR/AcrR family transcriptional regulator n=1 Tax=Actinocorallia sp. A-T 12471 TaxID=3089813 RepID=UPI0029CB1D84|nr:TetR/AcrR family transcriptional regulator [Actinocorallia sp. A-T 12471]MDX6738291.1 TetR/AcrR family transcriptional regulator [Actinocorallia sp. A-T 12471]
MGEPTSEPGQRLLSAALGLFAELGYDQTTSQLIADVAGLPVVTIRTEFGGKRELYLAVIKHVHEEEQALLDRMTETYTHDAAGIHRLLDQYLDHFVDHPREAALWMQRRMYDASDLRDIERLYSFPQIHAVSELTAELVRPDVDMELVIWGIVWSVQTFVYGGIPDAQGGRSSAVDRRAVARFRRHLHSSIDPLLRRDPDEAAS